MAKSISHSHANITPSSISDMQKSTLHVPETTNDAEHWASFYQEHAWQEGIMFKIKQAFRYMKLRGMTVSFLPSLNQMSQLDVSTEQKQSFECVPNINQSSSSYASTYRANRMKNNEPIVKDTTEYRIHNFSNQPTLNAQGIKRKRDGDIVKGQIKANTSETAHSGAYFTKPRSCDNVNNSQKPKHGRRSSAPDKKRRSDATDNSSRLPETVTLYTMPRMLPLVPGATNAANVPPCASLPGHMYQPPTSTNVGNPSLTQQRCCNLNCDIPGGAPYPMPCGHQYPIPGYLPTNAPDLNDPRKIVYQPSQYSYKPLCHEYPPAYSCGRWHRLIMQEEAKKKGLPALLNAMFCCCCLVEPEVLEAQRDQPRQLDKDYSKLTRQLSTNGNK